ncbi:hypothetical protein CLPUN_04580 [Clostridium puniceum]|uniref:Anti-sigma factor RsgI-like middle domain-containing protein n=1 Tax=Clostridium puniceum TaxID=29367 RepID=A0A1S8TWS2_9CLOT|nr:hypothetical protein [Clostridium puniceum]OOM82174.1 hypothetical protein CLPUN_04580 [Clostridium puniceum]
MEDKLFRALDNLNIEDTKLLLEKDINLSVDSSTTKRIKKSVMKKAGYYKEKSERKNKINNIIGGILMKKKIALALSVAVVLSLAGGGYAYAKTPVVYVSMDINPSVELGVNAFDTVVSVEAYNEEGKTILEGTDLLDSKVNDAVSTVISNAISDGYINEDGSSVIEITTSTNKTTGAAVKLDESLKNIVDETLSNNDVQAEVETENVALARRDEARKLGITPGKLNLIQKLQVLDPAITVEEYKNSSVKDIQKKTKELRKNVSIETTTEGSTSTGTATNTVDRTTTNSTTTNGTKADSTATNAVTSTGTTTDADEVSIIETEKNNKSSNNKASNGHNKKEEVNVSQEQKYPEAAVEKQNKNDNSNSQGNSSKEDKNSNIKTENNSDSSSSKSESSNNSKGNSAKSDNSGSSNSNSQGKGKNK